MSKLLKQSAPCPLCGQVVMVDAPEGTSEQELMALATEKCDCFEARKVRKTNEIIKKVREWATEEFGADDERLQVIISAIMSVSAFKFDKITIKDGQHTYAMDLDKDGLIRFKDKFVASREKIFR